MSYKTELQNNNADLQTILNKIKNPVMCTVTLTSSFDGVRNLDQFNGVATAYTLNDRDLEIVANDSALNEMGNFVDTTISLSVPKGSVLVLCTGYEYVDDNAMSELEWTPLHSYDYSIVGNAYVFFDGVYTRIDGNHVNEACAFVINDSCTITIEV